MCNTSLTRLTLLACRSFRSAQELSAARVTPVELITHYLLETAIEAAKEPRQVPFDSFRGLRITSFIPAFVRSPKWIGVGEKRLLIAFAMDSAPVRGGVLRPFSLGRRE